MDFTSKLNESLLRRFPTNEARLAYETTIPTTKQISKTDYDICFAIPYGKKAFLWHTFDGDQKVAVLIEMNRENAFGSILNLPFDHKKNHDFELGTIVSGVIYEEEEEHNKVFVVDDIHMYRGHQITRKTFREKSGYLFDFLQNQRYDLPIVLPVFWNTDHDLDSSNHRVEIPYTVRHYQYRSSSRILPHLCMSVIKKPGSGSVVVRPPPSFLEQEKEKTPSITQSHLLKRRFQMNWRFDYSKPAYRKTAFFYVRADTMFDVYFLGSLQENTIVYCQNALVQNYKTSVFLNGIFRNIRENANIDAIEESDDEEDFEDVRENKYVDLEKEVIMECAFHYKFRKWMPFRVAQEREREKVTSFFSL